MLVSVKTLICNNVCSNFGTDPRVTHVVRMGDLVPARKMLVTPVLNLLQSFTILHYFRTNLQSVRYYGKRLKGEEFADTASFA